MDLSALLAMWPAVTPYLALVPVVQVVAGALANVPRLWGVQHDTVWSRVMRTVAAVPILYRPQAPATDPSPSKQTGMARIGLLFWLVVATTTLAACATLGRALQATENAPVSTACVALKDPIKDSSGTKTCDQFCVNTDPPSVVWRCQPIPQPNVQ